ncbi:MAG: hypothetical protein E7J78_26660 [Pantoea sp.]|nr:hypothetical protein [Pantoea sp.]
MTVKVIAIIDGHHKASMTNDLALVQGHVDFTPQGGMLREFTALVQRKDSWLLSDVVKDLHKSFDEIIDWLTSENQSARRTLDIHPDAAITKDNVEFVYLVLHNGMSYPIATRAKNHD